MVIVKKPDNTLRTCMDLDNPNRNIVYVRDITYLHLKNFQQECQMLKYLVFLIEIRDSTRLSCQNGVDIDLF